MLKLRPVKRRRLDTVWSFQSSWFFFSLVSRAHTPPTLDAIDTHMLYLKRRVTTQRSALWGSIVNHDCELSPKTRFKGLLTWVLSLNVFRYISAHKPFIGTISITKTYHSANRTSTLRMSRENFIWRVQVKNLLQKVKPSKTEGCNRTLYWLKVVSFEWEQTD